MSDLGSNYYPGCKIGPDGRPYDCGPDWAGWAIAAALFGGGLAAFFLAESKSNGTTTPIMPASQ